MSSAPFTHTPRPALVTDSHPTQRYFGADRYTATCGLLRGKSADFECEE